MISFKEGRRLVPVSSLAKRTQGTAQNVHGRRPPGEALPQCNKERAGAPPICSEREYATAIRVRLDFTATALAEIDARESDIRE
jgi:hypothetical protein